MKRKHGERSSIKSKDSSDDIVKKKKYSSHSSRKEERSSKKTRWEHERKSPKSKHSSSRHSKHSHSNSSSYSQDFAHPKTKDAPKNAIEGGLSPYALEKAKKDINFSRNMPISQDEIENPMYIKLDKEGRILDERGNVIHTKPGGISTLKININKEKEKKVRELYKIQRANVSMTMKRECQFFDPNLTEADNRKEKKKYGAFNFIEKGTILHKGDQMRRKQIAKQLGIDHPEQDQKEEKKEDNAENKDSKLASSLDHIRKHVKVRAPDPIPDIEWWDVYFLPPNKKSFNPYDIRNKTGENFETISATATAFPKTFNLDDYLVTENDIVAKRITHYVQHPIPVKNDYVEKIKQMSVPFHLTDREKKKLRRIKRQEKERDKQDKIKLGLMDPPPPKIKKSNFLQVLGIEALADPSKTDKKVKKIIEARHIGHLERNESRKLTKDQRHEKFKRKLQRSLLEECRVLLFRIESLANPSHRFKVDKNAEQYMLTGVCLIGDKEVDKHMPSLVLVEGGQTAIKRYKRLLLRRVDWNQPIKINPEKPNEKEKITQQETSNACALIWEGVLKRRTFDKWKVVDFRSENEARRILSDKSVEHYWNMVINYEAPKTEEEQEKINL